MIIKITIVITMIQILKIMIIKIIINNDNNNTCHRNDNNTNIIIVYNPLSYKIIDL